MTDEILTVTAKQGVVYIDHSTFVLQVTARGSESAGIRIFSFNGPAIDFDLQLIEIPAVVSVLQEVLARAAERKLTDTKGGG